MTVYALAGIRRVRVDTRAINAMHGIEYSRQRTVVNGVVSAVTPYTFFCNSARSSDGFGAAGFELNSSAQRF